MRSARHFRFSGPSAVLTATLVAASVGSSGARAEDAAQLADVYATLKSLQTRINTLEAENRAVKQETASARAEARDLRKKLVSPAASGAPAALAPPSPAYAMATKAPPLPPAVPSWGGLYAGAAFGLASLHSQVDETDHTTVFETITSIPPGTSEVLTQTFDSASSLSGRNVGAIANLFLGYNAVLSERFVVGGQIEGGVSNIRVNLNGARTSVATTNAVLTPGGTSFSATQTSTSSATDALDNKWMVSALARGGVLVDPVDLVYLIGGWTYGRFEFGQSFGLNGGTIGAGWERQVAPGWTLRAEGRYTKFETKTLTTNATNNIASISTNAGVPTAAINISTTDSVSDRISADMWSVWLGFAHTFN